MGSFSCSYNDNTGFVERLTAHVFLKGSGKEAVDEKETWAFSFLL